MAGRTAAVVHNPTAGAGAWSRSSVEAMFAAWGSQVRYVSTKDSRWRARMHAAVGGGVDVVVVIGGDGTVRKVVTELAGSPIPIQLIPAGTANNVARGVDAAASPPPAGHGGSACEGPSGLVAVDVPALGGCLSGRFIESVGGGLFARLLADAESAESSGTRKGGLVDGRRRLLDLSRTASASPWRLWFDGDEVTGRFWAVEVLNIGAVGPRVPLAPDAEPGDGLLDCVLLGEEHRDTMIDHLTEALVGDVSGPASSVVDAIDVPERRCRTITAECPAGTLLHVDDRCLETDAPARWVASVDGVTVRVAVLADEDESGSGGNR